MQIFLAVMSGLLSVLIWGAHGSLSVLAIRESWTSLDLTAVRFIGTLLIAVPWLIWTLREGRTVRWLHMLAITAFAGAPFTLINIAGLQFAPVTHGAAISLGLVPVLIGLLSRPLLGQAVEADHWIALSCILAAVGIIWSDDGFALIYLLGDLCFFIGALLWALYAIAIRRWQVPPAEAVFYASLGSSPYLVWYFLARDLPAGSPDMLALQLVYQGLMVGLLALFLYGHTVRVLGPQLDTLFTAMVPAGVPVIAGWVIDYQTSTAEYIGLYLVIAGMLIAFYKPLRRHRSG